MKKKNGTEELYNQNKYICYLFGGKASFVQQITRTFFVFCNCIMLICGQWNYKSDKCGRKQEK